MDRLEAMRLFAAVAELGSFTAAARHDGVTPAKVSKKIAALEKSLGARLMARTTRSVALTEAGRIYLDGVRAVLEELAELEEEVRADHTDAAGLLRITAPVIFGARWLTPAVLSFLCKHPRVDARLSLSDRFVDLVEEGFDVAVRIGNLPDSSLVARRLAAARLSLVATPKAARTLALAHPSDLAETMCVLDLNYPSPRRWKFTRGDETAEVRIEGRFGVDSAEAARIAAVEGVAIALVPSFVACDDLAAGRLVRLLPDWEPEHRDIWAVFAQNRHVPARTRLLVDHLVATFDGAPAWERAAEAADAAA